MLTKLKPNSNFVGARLEIARTLRGMTLHDVANGIASSFGAISHYENGRKQPTNEMVDALAEWLGVAPAFFYEPLVDIWRDDECSFRHRRRTPEKVKSRARAYGTLISQIVNHLASVLRFPPYNVPQIPAATTEDIEKAAERCRMHWKLGIDTPILEMGRVLEHAGVVIVQNFAYSDKIDAFSRRGDVSIVVLNTAKNSTSRLIFDLAHECGHLVIHGTQVTGSEETETAADYFAGAFLLPRKAFTREFTAQPFSWPHVFDLKKRWRTSAAAIIRRAYQLRLMTSIGYRQTNRYMSAMGWTKSEPNEPDFAGPELLPTALRTVEEGLGTNVASICGALHLTPNTFAELTGIIISPVARRNVISFGRKIDKRDPIEGDRSPGVH